MSTISHWPLTVELLTDTAPYSPPKRCRPSITGDIINAKVARELAQERASMIKEWGPPVYGLVDIRDRIGARALVDAPELAPAPPGVIGRRRGHSLRDSSSRTPSRPRPRGHRRGEVEALQANMTKGERETYRQHASTADAAEEPRRRLRSARVRKKA